MAILVGAIAALCIGFSDLSGRKVVAASSTLAAAAIFQIVAACTALVAVGFVDSELIASDVGRAAISGLGIAIGMVAYYTSLSKVGAAVAAPVVASLSAVIPYLYAVLTGTTPSGLALFGAGLALIGIVVVSTGGRRSRTPDMARGVTLALVAGCSYGIGLSALVDASDTAGAWPAVVQRGVAFLLLVIVAWRRSISIVPPTKARMSALSAGILSGMASTAHIVALAIDPTPAIITTSMFPIVSVNVGRVFFKDTISRLQVIGIGFGLAGVVAVALG